MRLFSWHNTQKLRLLFPPNTQLLRLSLFQHRFQLVHILLNLFLEGPQIREDVLGRRVFDGGVFDLFVFVEAEVVVVVGDFLFRHEEGLLGAFPPGFSPQVVEALDDVGEVVLIYGAALVVEAKPVRLHVVEPDILRAALPRLREDEDGRRDAGIGLEDAGRHRDDRLEPILLHEGLADGLVRLRRAEQHAIRDDAGTAAAHAQHPQEEREKEQLRLFRLADLQQVG